MPPPRGRIHLGGYKVGGEFDMRISMILTAGVLALGLTACEKKAEDAQADAVRDNAEMQADSMEAQADAMDNQATGTAVGEAQNEAAADTMRAEADLVEEKGEIQADAIEETK
ncbi:hypothetical protein GCM10007973_15710 [Polymorphobacter multimanifer]|nr:hypothetical protein GCM10007973_15710 [Polymorphobacter multimanifer]